MRLKFTLQVLQGEFLCSVFKIEGKYQFVVIEIDAVDKIVNQALASIKIVNVGVAEFLDVRNDMLLGDLRTLQLLQTDCRFKLLLTLLQFVKALLGGGCENSLLDRIKHILNMLLDLF